MLFIFFSKNCSKKISFLFLMKLFLWVILSQFGVDLNWLKKNLETKLFSKSFSIEFDGQASLKNKTKKWETGLNFSFYENGLFQKNFSWFFFLPKKPLLSLNASNDQYHWISQLFPSSIFGIDCCFSFLLELSKCYFSDKSTFK